MLLADSSQSFVAIERRLNLTHANSSGLKFAQREFIINEPRSRLGSLIAVELTREIDCELRFSLANDRAIARGWPPRYFSKALPTLRSVAVEPRLKESKKLPPLVVYSLFPDSAPSVHQATSRPQNISPKVTFKHVFGLVKKIFFSELPPSEVRN